MQPWPAVEHRTFRIAVATAIVMLLTVLAAPAAAAPPANDNFAAAEVLLGDNASASGTLVEATKETGEPNHGGRTGGNSVWYRWTATSDRVVEITVTGAHVYPGVAVYTGATVDGLVPIASVTDASYTPVRFKAVAGRTYHIGIDRATYYFAGPIQLTLSAQASPANDDFADAATLEGSSDSDTATNHAATAEPGEPGHGSGSATRSVWWTWTAPSTGGATIHLTGSDFTPSLAVYTGDSVSGLVRVAASGTGSSSGKAVFRAIAGTTYRIAVDGNPYSYSKTSGTIAVNVSLVPPPGNDAFASATDLGSSTTATATGRNDGASGEEGEPQHYAYSTAKSSVWYAWTAPSRGSLTIRADAGFGTVLAAYTGTSVASLTRVANQPQNYNGGPEQIRIRVEAGETYRIAVDSAASSTGGTFNLSLNLIDSPANDDFADAQVLVGTDIDLDGTNVGATQEPGEPRHDDNYYDPSVWYSWTAPATGGATLDLAGSALNAVHGVYTGDSVGALTRVNSTRSTSGTRTKRRFRAVAGTTYRIAIDGANAAMGTFHLSLDLRPVPANDMFVAAEPLAGLMATATGDNIAATGEPGEPNAGGTAGASVWYRWTAPSDGLVKVASNGGSDPSLTTAIYTGSSVDALTLRGSSRASVEAGTVYSIAVHGGSAPTRATFTLSLTHVSAPANDDFATAEPLVGTDPQATGSNEAATIETGEPKHCSSCYYTQSRSVWHSWTPAESGTHRLSFTGAYGTVVAVYTGSSLDALTPVARSTSYSSGGSLTLHVTGGTTYRIALASDYYYDEGGAYTLKLATLAPPANDNFAAATQLTGTTADAAGSTVDATLEQGEPKHCTYTSSTAPSVWFKWTAPTSGRVTLSYGSSFQYAAAAVYTGETVGQLTTVVKSYDYVPYQKQLVFNAIAGTTYRIAMSGVYDSKGAYSLKLDLVVPPANDHFADATVLDGATDSHSGSSQHGSRETDEPAHAGFTATRSVWHRWQAPASGPVTIDTAGSSFDTVLGVYTGSSLGSLSTVASNDDSGGGTSSSVTFVATAGAIYRIAVDGKSSSSGGAYTLNVAGTPPAPPEPPQQEQQQTPPDDSTPPDDGGDDTTPPDTGGDDTTPPDTGGDDTTPPDTGGDDTTPPDNGGGDTTPPGGGEDTTSGGGSGGSWDPPTPEWDTTTPTPAPAPPAPSLHDSSSARTQSAPLPRPVAPKPAIVSPTAPLTLTADVPAQRLSAVLKRGLAGATACSKACDVAVKVTFTAAGKGRKGRAASTAKAKASAKGSRWVVKVGKAAKRKLRGARSVKAVVTITATSGGETATTTRRVTLKR